MVSSDEGMRYCRAFLGGITADERVFYKPTDIDVYSAPPPVHSKLIKYKIAYWNSKLVPGTDAEWLDHSLYTHKVTGETTFVFTVSPNCNTRHDILQAIHKHFIDTVMRNKPMFKQESAVELLGYRNTAEFKSNVADHDVHVGIFNIYHLETITLADGKSYVGSANELHYTAMSLVEGVLVKDSSVQEIVIQYPTIKYTKLGATALDAYLMLL